MQVASITKQRVGKYTYIYKSVSFRDEQGRPRNKKSKIGKIDPYTGETTYTSEYIRQNSLDTKTVITVKKIPSEVKEYAQQFFDSVKVFGVFWFLHKIADKIGLLGVLQQVFPTLWQELFTVASYLVVSDKPMMYCEDWLAENEWLEVGSMSSQRISELFTQYDEKQRNQFYRLWSGYILEREYLALDITSISSYSKQIADCEWGHNRDNEKLPQVNLCMLHGETSRLPVFQTTYSGSLTDVTTLESTISEFRALVGEREIKVVMDRGFYREKNVKFLIKQDVHFLVGMSFNNNKAKQLVEDERQNIDRIENVIHTNDSPIRGVQRLIDWPNSEKKIQAHIYFDPEKAMKERNELYGHIAKLKEIALSDPNNTKFKKDIEYYLVIKDSESDKKITVREDVVAQSLQTTGWFVLLSNYINDPQQALGIYRMKDVVEKSFWKYKNILGLHRLRVHTDERVLNKTFVAFIALILSSHIHNVMRTKELYKIMTFDKLFIMFAKLKSATVSGHKIMRPVSKQIRDILKIFVTVQTPL